MTVIWVVVIWVLVTIVEPAIAPSREISRIRLHNNLKRLESLQGENAAIVARQWVVVVEEMPEVVMAR